MKNSLPLLICVIFGMPLLAQDLSLQGQWTVRLEDRNGPAYNIQLPGTLDDARIGKKNRVQPALDIAALAHLARKVEFTGKAYYSRSFRVPASWKGRPLVLELGRVLWQSTLWIDGQLVPGKGESLVAAHRFDITSYVKAGQSQTITLCIDNSNIYPGINVYAKQYPSKESSEMTHAYTNHTQIKWNGVLGAIRLVAQPALHWQQITVAPNLTEKQLHIQYQVKQEGDKTYSIHSYVVDTRTGKRWPGGISLPGLTKTASTATIPFPAVPQYWDEFNPQLYQLVSIVSSAAGKDTLRTNFGIRELMAKQGDLYLNGKRIFLRSNLECIIFPLKGYPPMQLAEWKKLFTTAKSYGLNSFRFHSWCPPAVAFEAADALGFYLQVELPHWNLTVGADTASFAFLEREAKRIIDEYGNHPSFLFFSMGNELEGDFDMLNKLVARLKQTDPRHLYSTTTFTFQKELTGIPQPQDDFYVTQWTKKGWVRGQGVFNDEAPNFAKDYSAAAEGLQIPLISHEIGQYSVFPDIKEIASYTGNLVPQNLIGVRNDLRKKKMLHLAPAYLQATGRFATLLYKEEMERAYKTKGFDGFQLLQLQDFPGQGTALVGLLNAFWKSKGFLDARQFRTYCSELTPLLRFPKAIYTNQENFEAAIELANFYKPLKKAALLWTVRDDKGKVWKSGNIASADYAVGNCIPAGVIQAGLQSFTSATQLTVEVSVIGTPYRNNWKIWVYPASVEDNAQEVLITADLERALQALDKGSKVLLCPLPDTLKGIPGKFVPVFWSPVHFPDQPGTMGLLVKERHKALSAFPTAFHSDWQWWDLAIRSKTLVVDSLPEKAIIVRVIDNFVRNQQLANLWEARVGKGRLVFCSMDILHNLAHRPTARQLRYSLLQYMNDAAFQPAVVIEAPAVRRYFK